VNGGSCRGELVVRAQRGALTDAGQLALAVHLAQCASCRLDQQIFDGFAEEGVVEIRDGARIDRLSASARSWALRQDRSSVSAPPSVSASASASARGRSGGRRGAPRLRAWAAAALVVFVAGTASAAAWWWQRPAVAPASLSGASRSQRMAAASGRWSGDRRLALTAPGPATAEASLVPPVAMVPPPAEAPPAPVPARRLVRAPRAGGGATAAALLRQAGDARRAGDQERATALYRKVQRDFAGSSEAVLSTVPLASLLLERGFPRAALAELDRYLAASRGGVLIPEALYGRARALGALGDRAEEQRTWQRLLGDFSESVYAPLARRRLAELR
jgi:hypothetical protein